MAKTYSANELKERLLIKYTNEYNDVKERWIALGAFIQDVKNYSSANQLYLLRKQRMKLGREVKQLKIKLDLLS